MRKLLPWVPFYYFWSTRLRTGSVLFHFTFEWLSAAILVCSFGKFGCLASLSQALGCYFSFISVYEVGYICNDYFAGRNETNPRRRGSEQYSLIQILSMILSRLVAFSLATWILGRHTDPGWYSFYAALGLTFSLHNLALPVEFKAITFAWLSLFRFTAPSIFILHSDYVPSLFLSALLFYTGYRLLPYLDSKGVLNLPGRRTREFRLVYFVSMLPLAWFLEPYPGGQLIFLMALYFSVLAVVGYVTDFESRHRA